MLFYRQVSNAFARIVSNRNTETTLVKQGFRGQVVRQFKRNKRALWALRIIYVLISIALFADILANDKPLICSINHAIYFPAFKSMLVECGLAQWTPPFALADWQKLPYDWQLMPPIPY